MNRILAYASLATATFFILALISLHFLSSEFNPIEFGISFYALTRYGYLIGLAFGLVGVAGILLAIAMWSATPSKTGRVGLILVIAWGLFQILAGLFPLDALGSHGTLSGRIHNLAGMNFLLVTPALLLIELGNPAGGRNHLSRKIAYWLAWLLLLASVLLFTFNGPLSSLGIGGAIQRVYWLVLVSWLLVKSIQIIRAEKIQLEANLIADSI